MAKTSYQLTLPTEIVNELHLEHNQLLNLTLRNGQLILQPINNPNENQTLSLRHFLMPSIFMAVIFTVYALNQQMFRIPLGGDKSIASAVIILSEVSGILMFLVTYIQQQRKQIDQLRRKTSWRVLPALTVAFVIILAFITSGFFWAINYLFQTASFDLFTSIALFTMFNSIVNFLMIYSALSISTLFITSIFVITIIGGVLTAMVTNSSRMWWQYNLSFLGTENALDSWQFNATLILAGLIWIALVDYLFVPLQKIMRHNKRLITLRILLNLSALALAGVGTFPNNAGKLHILHDQMANFLIYFILIMMLGNKWLLPKAPQEFKFTSYIIFAILVVNMALFQWIGYLSLTTFEIIAFVLALSWILLLFQNIYRLYYHTYQTFVIPVS
ncbi:transcriptional regulator [Leuconostoc litchii]|uniref:AbrB/MazE/SpoVT family DNA-binding domain-containing protein n=1 Tax=Leuconostoc litchii TaxID=1981069 RepID=A0A6P2CPK1_9LACO|nr:AbrB/MazE/SpoVT family DNA-binding domain-containing protein [Leuconostoc litchii]TYC46122.1 AbrB/MazE/SpoVT family DNA-binding domain-containing protein [Leuconostoc litchii]GMA69789.1 transcriptional regulator [Leuconostoc litchii]